MSAFGKDIGFVLNQRERNLLLKYAYPFEALKKELLEAKGMRRNVEIVAGCFDWEQAVGNLSISVNEDLEDGDLIMEIDELACLIEDELGLR